MPEGYSVPGNHDLPNHNILDIHRSGYETLVYQEKLIPLYHIGRDIGVTSYKYNRTIHVRGFPFGKLREISAKALDLPKKGLKIAVAHEYVWRSGKNNPAKASDDSQVKVIAKQLKGFDTLLVGDNHIPFFCRVGDLYIWNGGTFIRRRADEIKIKPRLGIVFSDGTVLPWYLDTSKDRFVAIAPEIEKVGIDPDEFLETLHGLSDVVHNFRDAVTYWANKHVKSYAVRALVLSLLRKPNNDPR